MNWIEAKMKEKELKNLYDDAFVCLLGKKYWIVEKKDFRGCLCRAEIKREFFLGER